MILNFQFRPYLGDNHIMDFSTFIKKHRKRHYNCNDDADHEASNSYPNYVLDKGLNACIVGSRVNTTQLKEDENKGQSIKIKYHSLS